MRPPPIFRHSVCEMTPRSDSDSMTLICACRSLGNWPMIRSTVDAAVVVWSVPNTRWPVSAVSIAIATVSRSRISPTRMMSGSSRSAARSAPLNESVCVSDLALVDQALPVLVHELDRILDRDDVVVAVPVDVVDHRAERRRLARTGRAGHEHEALRQVAQLEDVRRETQLLGRQDLASGITRKTAPGPLRSTKMLARKRASPRDLVGEVRVMPRARTPRRSSRERSAASSSCMLGEVERRRALFERLHAAVFAHQRRHPDRKVQVRRAGGRHGPEQPIDRRSGDDGRGRRRARPTRAAAPAAPQAMAPLPRARDRPGFPIRRRRSDAPCPGPSSA